jgi:hypothetical protein
MSALPTAINGTQLKRGSYRNLLKAKALGADMRRSTLNETIRPDILSTEKRGVACPCLPQSLFIASGRLSSIRKPENSEQKECVFGWKASLWSF